jgi:hypothetical protein
MHRLTANKMQKRSTVIDEMYCGSNMRKRACGNSQESVRYLPIRSPVHRLSYYIRILGLEGVSTLQLARLPRFPAANM